jgi:hypothetical protein
MHDSSRQSDGQDHVSARAEGELVVLEHCHIHMYITRPASISTICKCIEASVLVIAL